MTPLYSSRSPESNKENAMMKTASPGYRILCSTLENPYGLFNVFYSHCDLSRQRFRVCCWSNPLDGMENLEVHLQNSLLFVTQGLGRASTRLFVASAYTRRLASYTSERLRRLSAFIEFAAGLELGNEVASAMLPDGPATAPAISVNDSVGTRHGDSSSADVADVIHAKYGGKDVPAVVWGHSLHNELQNWANAFEQIEAFSGIARTRREAIRVELDDVESKLDSLRARDRKGYILKRRIRDLETVHLRLLGEWDTLREFLDTISRQAETAQHELSISISRMLSRFKLLQSNHHIGGMAGLREALNKVAEAGCNSESESSSGSWSTHESEEDLPQIEIRTRIGQRREEFINALEDRQGRRAEQAVQRMSVEMLLDYLDIPPRDIVDQLALVDASEAVRKVVQTERAYKRSKRRAAVAGIDVDRELSDDSEFSWDLESGAGESLGSDRPHPGYLLESRKRGRRFQDALQKDLADPYTIQSPPSSFQQLALGSASMGSGLSGRTRWDRKRAKRLKQWRKNQRYWDVEVFQDRLRQRSRRAHPRPVPPRINRWMAQKPKNLRWIGGQRAPSPDDSDSLRSFTQGTFQHWNRRWDPGTTPSHNSERSLGVPSPGHGYPLDQGFV